MNMPNFELWNTIYSVAFGGAVGVFYDALRLLRKLIFRNSVCIFISDILFLSVSAVGSFLFAIITLNGNIRLLNIVFIMLGFLLYYLSFGSLTVKLFDFMARCLDRFYDKLCGCFGRICKNNKKNNNKSGKIKIYSSIFIKKNIK